jgi:hypothetical protein
LRHILSLSLLFLTFTALSCNEQLPVGTGGADVQPQWPVKVLPTKALNYPLAVGNIWVYDVREIATRTDASGQRYEPDTSSFIDSVIVRRATEPAGGWMEIEERMKQTDPYSSRIPFVTRYESAYRSDTLWIRQIHFSSDSIAIAVSAKFLSPPVVGVFEYSSIEFPDFGPAAKQAEMVAGSVTTPAGSFDSCGLYTARYDNASTGVTFSVLETSEIVRPGVGLIHRSQRLTTTFSNFRILWVTRKILSSYTLHD